MTKIEIHELLDLSLLDDDTLATMKRVLERCGFVFFTIPAVWPMEPSTIAYHPEHWDIIKADGDDRVPYAHVRGVTFTALSDEAHYLAVGGMEDNIEIN